MESLKAIEHALRWADIGLRYVGAGNIVKAQHARDYAQGWCAKAMSIEKFRQGADHDPWLEEESSRV